LIDEPDYEKHIEGFSEAKEKLSSWSSNNGEGGRVLWTSKLIDQVYPVFQTGLFFLQHVS